MNRAILSITLGLFMVNASLLRTHAVKMFSSQTIPKSVHFEQCFQDAELTDSLATLKLQGLAEVSKVSESLLSRARNSPGCRSEVVRGLIRAMEQTPNPIRNRDENYFLWVHGSALLAELNATEALDLLIANIDLSDGWSASISQEHLPALVAILSMGEPAIQKLQIVLRNDSESHRRRLAAFGIAYIGGSQARKALTAALPGESDPCVKNFVRVSIQAFDNKTKPNHINSSLNGKWLSAFYCP